MKKAPGNFEDEEDVGDVDDNLNIQGKPGPSGKYQADNGRGMAIDQRGAARSHRSNSGKILYLTSIAKRQRRSKRS